MVKTALPCKHRCFGVRVFVLMKALHCATALPAARCETGLAEATIRRGISSTRV
jgi:hypothetical protein